MKTDFPTPQDGGKQEQDRDDPSDSAVQFATELLSLHDERRVGEYEFAVMLDEYVAKLGVSSVNSIAGMKDRVAELEGALQKIAWDCGPISSFHDRATKIARSVLTPPQENKA